MLNATKKRGLLESMLNADNKYLSILDVISREVKVIIKNSYRTIKKYFSSFYQVVGKTPKRNTSKTKRKKNDSGGGDSDPDPDCPLCPKPPYLTIPQSQQNSSLPSWRTAPGYCGMPGGERHD